MFDYVKNGIKWAMALSAYEKGDFEKAKENILEMRGKHAERSEIFALLGAINVCLEKIQEAKLCLFRAKEGSTPGRSEYKEYINIYCDYYLSSIDRQEARKIVILEKAIKMKAPSLIKKWLPLS